MQEIIQHLDSTARRARRLLIGRRLAMLISAVMLILLLAIALDWLARFSPGTRMVMFIMLAITVVVSIAAWVVPAFLFHPGRGRLALRFERIEPGLEGRLASSIEFEESGLVETSPLAAATVNDTRRRLHGVSIKSMINTGPALKAMGVLLVLVVVMGTWIGLEPASAGLGFTRILAPWSPAQWPPRTAVASRMNEIVPEHRVHGQGLPLLLRAENLTRGRPGDPVLARYRLIEDAQPASWTEVVMTYQRDGIHERLIPTGGEAIEFEFETSDAKTELERVLLVPLPQVEDVALTITPPAHARPWEEERHIESMPGSRGLNVIRPPVMEGSSLTLDIKINRKISAPLSGAARIDWMQQTFGWPESAKLPTYEVDPGDPTRWSLNWEADSSQRLLIALQDEFGLESIEPVPVQVPVVPDRLPDVVLLEPEQDLDVLPTAVIPLVAEAVDNLPLRSIGIEVSRDEEEPIYTDVREVSTDRSRMESPLDLLAVGAAEGDVLRVHGVAIDRWQDDQGGHREARSRVRTLRVVTEPEFLSQLRDQLALLEQRAMDLEENQRDVQESYQELVQEQPGTTREDRSSLDQDDVTDPGRPGMTPESRLQALETLERRQADVSRRLSDQLAQAEAVRDWLEVNALSDERIEEVLDQVDEALADGREASSEAMQSMESSTASSRTEPGDPGSQSAQRQARQQASDAMESQQEVREALQDVVEALAEDQESWLLSRRLDGIESQQQALRERTRALSSETRGQRLDELSPELRSEIEDAARDQDALLEAVSELSDDLTALSEAMEDIDPAGALAMERTAEVAEEQEVESRMAEAADDLEEGRLEMAGGSQQQAMEALQAMRGAMSPDQQDRIADLLRRLIDLEQAVRQLVAHQSEEIDRLKESIKHASYEDRDDAMIAIRRRTLAVSDEASSQSDQERDISRRLDRAGDAQSDAIGILRNSPVDGPAAQGHEVIALEQLQAALDDLDEMQSEAEEALAEAGREALAESYRALGERQFGIRVQTAPLVDPGLSTRRSRHESRRLSVEQVSIGDEARTLRAENLDIETRPIFVLMHERVEEASLSTSEDLSEAQPDSMTLRSQDRIARDLLALADALESSSGEEEDFDRASSSGGGGSGGGGEGDDLLPPIAELKLLRSLQLEVMESTRSLDHDHTGDATGLASRVEALAKLQEELARLGQEMFDRHMDQDTPQLPTGEELPPPSARFDDEPVPGSPTGEVKTPRAVRSLDSLLGLDDSATPTTDPTPLPSNHDPLEAIVDEMDRAALLLGQDLVTGPPTQRLQQDIIRRIDSLIDQAQQQQSSQSRSGSSSSSPDQPGEQDGGDMEAQAGEEQQESQASQGGQNGRERGLPPGAEEARLGGVLEETDEEWGSLPGRVRDLLRQGRRDAYSSVYERLTGEYYRRLAEEQND